MLALALLIVAGPRSLHATPEWKLFERVISSKPQWMVLVMNKLYNGENFQFGEIRNGLRIGWSTRIQYTWDGKEGVAQSWSKKTWKPLSATTHFDRFYENGRPFFMDDWKSPPTKLVGYDAQGKRSKTGWQFRDEGRDYDWEGVYWFDDKTHLLTEYAIFGSGMVSLPEYAGTFRLFWTFDKKLVKDWSLTPPADYKRVD